MERVFALESLLWRSILEKSDFVQVRALIEGRVQAVGFRYFVHRAATDLSLDGWVRNLSDGRVELLAEGKQEDCDALLQLVSQGPSMSHVRNIETTWAKPSGGLLGFRMAPTANASS